MDLQVFVITLLTIIFAGTLGCFAEVCSYSYVSSYTTLYGTRYRTSYNYIYCMDSCCGYTEKYCCASYNYNARLTNVDFGEFVGVALGGLTGAILVIIICLACCVAIRKGKPDPIRNSANSNQQPVYRVNPETGATELQDLSRTFTLGQRDRTGQLYSGYMMDLSLPPPAYEHVVSETQQGGGENQSTEQNNNSTNISQRNVHTAPNTISARVQQNSEDSSPENDLERETDRIPRYQSVMRKGHWRNAGRTSFWTSVDDVGSQSTETLDSFVDLDEDTTNSAVTGISAETIDAETRISESNNEYVTHL